MQDKETEYKALEIETENEEAEGEQWVALPTADFEGLIQ